MIKKNGDFFKNNISNIASLPTIPVVALKIIKLLADEEVTFSQLEKVIAEDPPMVAKIMKIANSGFYRTANEVKSLKMAISILGLNEIRNLVFAISVFSSFRKLQDSEYFSFSDFWKHSAGVAKIALAITKFLKLNLGEAEFVAGLLHDIGRLILQSYFPEDYSEVFRSAEVNGMSLVAAEQKLWDVTHADIGGWLAENWSLHEDICEVIIKHHTIDFTELKNPDLVAIIALADHVTKIWGVSVEAVPFMEDINSSSAYKYLVKKYRKIDEIKWEKWLNIWDMEIDQAEKFIEEVSSM